MGDSLLILNNGRIIVLGVLFISHSIWDMRRASYGPKSRFHVL